MLQSSSYGFRQWLLVMTLLIFSAVTEAGTINLPAHGGNGGRYFTLDCGDERVLIGVSGRKGQWLDSIRAHCIKARTDGYWSGTPTASARVGGSGGSDNFSEFCERNSAVKRISGRYGLYVHQISLRCVPLGSSGTSHTITVSGSWAGPNSFSWDTCPDGKPARGFRGRHGNYIDRIGLTCHAGSTPTQPSTALPRIRTVQPR